MKKIILGFRCAVLGLALALARPAEATNYISGLVNASLGVATLSNDGSTLTVRNLTGSGNDGVRIFTGSGGGATARLGTFNPDILPAGAFLRWAAVDPADVKLQEFTVRRLATGGAIFADFNGLGAPTVTVSLFNDTTLLASAGGIPPSQPLANFSGAGPAGGGGGLPMNINPCVLHPEDCYGVIDIDVSQPDPTHGSVVTIPRHGAVLCTRIQIQPDLPLPGAGPQYRVKAIDITGANLGSLTVTSVGLIYFGLEHHTVGQSDYFFDVPESFTLGNLNSGPGNGMDVLLRNANGFGADWVALNPQPFPPTPGGSAGLTITASGHIGGGPEQTIGTLRMTAFASGMPLSGDFSGLGSRSQQVELWNSGAQIATYAVANGLICTITNPGWLPSGMLISPRIGSAASAIQFVLHSTTSIQVIAPSGQPFPADELRVVINDAQGPIDALTRVSFQVAGWDGLRFLRESPIRPPGIRCPTDPLVVTLPCTSNCVPVYYLLPLALNGAVVYCTPPPGTCLPAGMQPIICYASNALGIAECEFPVLVVPEHVEPPVIRCPPDIIVPTCNPGELVTYPDPIVAGISPGDYSLTCTPPSGSFFPVGTNTVVCCVRDRCERNTCCAFNVIIPQGITFAGNQHCPLGAATLTKDPANGTLVLGNITETGQDGVQIALGGADFCDVTTPFMASSGDSCRYEYRAVVDHIADRTAAVLTVGGGTAGEMQVTGDMSGLGATRYTLMALDGESQVAIVSNQPVATVGVTGSAAAVAPSLRWDIKTFKCYIRIKLPRLPGNPGPLIRLAPGLAVNGDNVIILPENPTRTLGAQNRVLLTVGGVRPQPKVLLSEELGLFGFGHTGLGDATLIANGDALTVGNVGDSGNNGVAIDLKASGNFLASFMPLDVSVAQGPHPVPWIQARAFGQFGDGMNYNLGSLRFTGVSPTAVELDADFSSIGASTHTIELWQAGQLVRRITGQGGTLVGTLNAWPNGLGKLVGAPSPFRVTFTGGVRVGLADGSVFNADELRVLAENSSAPVGPWASLKLQSSGFESFTIVNENSTPALTPRLGNIARAPGGHLQLTVPTAFGYKYSIESITSLAAPSIAWNPFSTFAGDGTPVILPLDSPDPIQQYYRVRVDNPFGPRGENPMPDMVFPHKVFLFLDNIIVDEARDPIKGDRPYLVTILFQTVLNKSNSTIVEVHEGEPHDWVSKPEYNGNGTLLKGQDHMLPQDMLPLPEWMGHFEWDDVQWNTFSDLFTQFTNNPVNFKPQIMLLGAAVVALQNNNTPPDRIRNLLNQLADGLKTQLVEQVESGQILSLGALSLLDPNLLPKLVGKFQDMSGDILKDSNINLWNIVDLLVSSLGDPDVPIGANLVLMPVIPGIQPFNISTNIPLLGSSVSVRGLMRPPDNFSSALALRGMGAAYRVNARVVPDFVPPPPPPPNQSDPTLVSFLTVFTKTGEDDLRSSSTATAEIRIKGRAPETFRLNDPNQGFDNRSPHTKILVLSSNAPYGDLESITLHVVQGSCGGCNSDNWNVDFLDVTCTGLLGVKPLFSHGGTPLVRLVEKDEHPENNEFISKTFPFTH